MFVPPIINCALALALVLGEASVAAFSLAEDKNLVTKKKVVVVGGGIGGLSTAFDATHILGKNGREQQVQVTVVSDQPNFTFVPSNPWVSIGKRKPSDIQLPLASILPRHHIQFIESKVTKLEPKSKHLCLKNGQKLEYDYLVIASGPRLAFEIVPGLKEYGHSICTAPHSVKAYEALQKLVENPGPVVVGATQDASCFGPAYEYVMLLQNQLYKRGGRELVEKCPISFVTSEPWIGHMGLGGVGTSGELLASLFTSHHHSTIQAYTNARVKRVNKDSVVMEQVDPQNGRSIGTLTLPSKLTMFIPPFLGHDVWKSVPGLTDSKGMILTNDFMQSKAYRDIFAVGVCVHIDPYEKTPVPTGVPKSGYMIESMGTAAVKNIHTLCTAAASASSTEHKGKGGEEPELHSKPLLNGLCITDFGDTGAIFVTLPQCPNPDRQLDVTYTGTLATLAKLAFEKYFLHKIESGDTDPYYEKYMLKLIGVERTKEL